MERQSPGGEHELTLVPPPEESRDEHAIQLGIEAARAEDREVDDAVARCIAAQLHGGQGSALYSLASTGSLEDDLMETELRELYQSRNPRIMEWASVLGTYALQRETPRAGRQLGRPVARQTRAASTRRQRGPIPR